ncbi:MAG: glutamate 5-kinase, partial [Hyphomicrobium sp.]
MTTEAKSAPESTVRAEWTNAKRIVVKIGSALLTDRATGTLKAEWLASLLDDVSGLNKAGKQVVLVSSGAIALGRHTLKLPKGPLELEQSQAAAAVGQISLAHAYQEMFGARGLVAAQILLTL